MILRSIAMVTLAAAFTAPAAAQNPQKASSHEIAVVTSGSEQALQVGGAVLSRPFGAQLVDRLSVVGSYRVGGRTYHLVRGDAAGDCPARYVVITREADGAPAPTEPFGTCSMGARGRVSRGAFIVTMPATAAGGPLVRFRYDQGTMRLIDAMPAAAVARAGGAPGFAAREASSCRAPTATDPVDQAAVLADFQRSYPAEFRKISTLKHTEIAPDELRATVTGLACLARWPGAEEIVPEMATPLFASKRYGPAAFASIDTIAKDPTSDVNLRAAVRAFGAEMLYRVDRREPL